MLILISFHVVLTEFRFAFTKYSNRKIDSLGIEYDYYSVMHYGAKAFSKNNRVTIKAKKPNIRTFGNTHLSPLDIKQANLLYRCMGMCCFLLVEIPVSRDTCLCA